MFIKMPTLFEEHKLAHKNFANKHSKNYGAFFKGVFCLDFKKTFIFQRKVDMSRKSRDVKEKSRFHEKCEISKKLRFPENN